MVGKSSEAEQSKHVAQVRYAFVFPLLAEIDFVCLVVDDFFRIFVGVSYTREDVAVALVQEGDLAEILARVLSERPSMCFFRLAA
jgi:hypothetical protein